MHPRKALDIPDYLKQQISHPIVKTEDGLRIDAYDAYWEVMTDVALELTAYRHNWQGNAFEHLRNAHHLIWPEDVLTWNYWTERRFRAHCEGHKIVVLAGGANCGKSYDLAKLSILFWLGNPAGRTTLVASTSLSDLDSRIWGYVKRFHGSRAAVDLSGLLYTSPPPKILLSKSDTIHGIFAVPLKRGSAENTISGLIGRHPDEGFLAIIDEGTDVAPAFMDAVPNWEKSPFFQMFVVGNSRSRYDPHGLLSQPIEGWDKIDPDIDIEWETKEGICLYFDCYQSPAITEQDPKKKALLSKFLFTERGIEEAKSKYGDNSPAFWRFTRGYWPPEDSAKTILTPVIIDKFNAKKTSHWSGEAEIYRIAGLDPAFGPEGDDCVLRFATLGKHVNGKWVLDYGGEENIVHLFIDADSTEPADYQIVHETMKHCKKRGVLPENVAVDVWGTGSGLGSIIENVWSKDIYKVSSAGSPSDTWVDAERTQRSKDVYDRRITEIWFSMRKFVQSGQIRGLDDTSCQQFCTRTYDWKGKKVSIETKIDYKLRMGKVDSRYGSPDRADAACLILDLARQFYSFLPTHDADAARLETPLIRKYFDQIGADSIYGDYLDPNQPRGEHPASWNDGFSVSEFDMMEEG